jgi:hypothetical protein
LLLSVHEATSANKLGDALHTAIGKGGNGIKSIRICSANLWMAHVCLRVGVSSCRYVATGGVVPLMSASAAAVYAAGFAEAAFRADNLINEAPLIQLLQHCSTALAVELSELDSPTAPPAAEVSAGSERPTAPAAGAAAAAAAAKLRLHSDAADSRPCALPPQAPASAGRSDLAPAAHSAGRLPAANPDVGVKQPLQQHGKQPPPEWVVVGSRWACSVAIALQVR